MKQNHSLKDDSGSLWGPVGEKTADQVQGLHREAPTCKEHKSLCFLRKVLQKSNLCPVPSQLRVQQSKLLIFFIVSNLYTNISKQTQIPSCGMQLNVTSPCADFLRRYKTLLMFFKLTELLSNHKSNRKQCVSSSL